MAAVDQSACFSMGDHTLKVPMELFALNRRRLAERLREKAPHSIVVLQGGSDSNHYCSDVDYKFQQPTDVENTFADDGNDSEWVAIENDGQSMKLRGSVLEIDGIEQKDESSNQPLELQFLNRKSSNGNRSGTRRRDSRKRKRANMIIETDDTNSESYVLPEEIIPKSNSAEAFDTCSMYCQLLAEKLRSMSSRNRIIVQNKIDNMVFKALMEELDAPGSQQKSSSLTAKESDVAGSRQKETPLDPLAIETSVCNMDEQILSTFEEEHHTVNN